jgi:hypothetical protein
MPGKGSPDSRYVAAKPVPVRKRTFRAGGVRGQRRGRAFFRRKSARRASAGATDGFRWEPTSAGLRERFPLGSRQRGVKRAISAGRRTASAGLRAVSAACVGGEAGFRRADNPTRLGAEADSARVPA